MIGKNMFGLAKDFRSATNKILVDYNRFKKWVYSKLMSQRKSEKETKTWSRRVILDEMINNRKDGSTMRSDARLTEDLLTEVKSFYRTNS